MNHVDEWKMSLADDIMQLAAQVCAAGDEPIRDERIIKTVKTWAARMPRTLVSGEAQKGENNDKS